jgi:salicylate hydroxylase
MRRALIAGAGVAGLVSALALAKSGLEAIVFERAAALEEFGAGLQLSPNCTRVLARFGALDAVARLASAPHLIRVLRGRDDAELSALDLSDATERWGAPYFVIHRADLQRALVELVGREASIELRLGTELVGYGANADRVQAAVKRGLVSMTEEGDLLVGADGLRSKVREKLGLGPEDAPAFTGRVAFRATLETQGLDRAASAPVVTLRLGPKAHLVQYPLRHGDYVNLVAVIEAGWRGAPPDHPWNGEADRPALMRAFAGWSKAARALVATPRNWRAWPLYVRPSLPNYATGRVALAGDAAHPMVPFLAQGAAQAIEDAGALARSLATHEDTVQALAAYSAERAPRAGRVQREALAQTRVYHMSGPMAFARDLAMRGLGSDRLLKRYDWLYGA